MVHTAEHRIGGRIRAAGCRPTDEQTIIPEECIKPLPKDSIVPLITETHSRQRQRSPRSLKLAMRDVMEHHRIDGRAAAKVLGMDVSAFSPAVTLELDTLNASYLAEKLGLAVRGAPEMPMFVREVA